MTNYLFRLMLTLFLLILPASASAASYQWLTTEDLVDQSRSIVVGTCVSADYREVDGTVFGRVGYYGFHVEEVIKGTPPITEDQLSIRLVGIGARNAPFRQGQGVLLFLGSTNPDGFATLYGAEQGVLHIEEAGPLPRHPRRLMKGIIKERITGRGLFHGRGQMPLDEFLDMVRARLNEGKK